VFVVSVQPGQEIVKTVTGAVREKGVENAAIVSFIGAVDSACISNMPKGDATDDILTEYSQPMEMSGTGEIKDGKVHIHAVFGTEGDVTVSGHLHWARVETHFANAYVLPL